MPKNVFFATSSHLNLRKISGFSQLKRHGAIIAAGTAVLILSIYFSFAAKSDYCCTSDNCSDFSYLRP